MTYYNIQNKIQNVGWNKRPVSNIQNIVVHHSAYRFNDENNNQRFASLKKFHTNQGWVGLSYHYVIFENGEIWQTNNHDDLTWTDGINWNSLGILVDGYFHDNKDKPTIEQLGSLDFLLGKLCNEHPEFPATRKDVKAHREVNSTACCGDDLFPYVVEWRNTGKLAIIEQSQQQPSMSQKAIDLINQEQILSQDDKTALTNAVYNNDQYYLANDNISYRKEASKLQKEKEAISKQLLDTSSDYAKSLSDKKEAQTAQTTAEEKTRGKEAIIRQLEIKNKDLDSKKEELKQQVLDFKSQIETLNQVLDGKQKIVIKQGEKLEARPVTWSWTEAIIGQLRSGLIPSLSLLVPILITMITSPEYDSTTWKRVIF